MKLLFFKKTILLSASALMTATLLVIMTSHRGNSRKKAICCNNPDAGHVCVMKTIFGIDTSAASAAISTFKTSAMVEAALKKGLTWMSKAQNADGGWGSGSHYRQDIRDPHAVQSDPATTSLVAMALLRTENTLEKGDYAVNLKESLEYLLKTVENCPEGQQYLTTQQNTQPQTKLGRNIDVILTAQFFTNMLRFPVNDEAMKMRIEKALDKCVARIQKTQDNDGSWKDGGWAPVLQSALANNALEAASDVGRSVDSTVLIRGYKYQKSNFNTQSNSVVTDKAAGVLLYGLSSTTRSSAKESRKAKDLIAKAKKEGKISNEDVTAENLEVAGVNTVEAKELETAYSINKASQDQAIRGDVMVGYGNNGGEEFMSFLMTGESIMMQGGDEWKKWYDMMSGKLVNLQTPDGAWQGHHCITSPVFCTATCILILSIHNDMQFSMKQHPAKNN
jgi:hypothetical protein